MKKRILFIVSFAVAVLLQVQLCHAGLVYSTNFDSEPYTGNRDPLVLGGTDADVTAGQWFGADTNQGAGIAGGDITLDNAESNRFRGSGVWLDTTGWTSGLVTVEIDVTDFVSGANSELLFQAYSATGVDAMNTVSLDLHEGSNDGAILDKQGLQRSVPLVLNNQLRVTEPMSLSPLTSMERTILLVWFLP